MKATARRRGSPWEPICAAGRWGSAIQRGDGLQQVFLGGEILRNGNINGSRPRRFLAGSGFAECVVQCDVNVAAHDP